MINKFLLLSYNMIESRRIFMNSTGKIAGLMHCPAILATKCYICDFKIKNHRRRKIC